MTINGRHITKLKKEFFDTFCCPVCKEHIEIRGLCTSIVDVIKGGILSHPQNPFSEYYFVPSRISNIQCKNKHESKIIVQYLLKET